MRDRAPHDQAGGTPTALRVPAVASRQDVVNALADFINGPLRARHGAKASWTPVDSRTPLFSTGAIDSLGILDLLMFVELATGRPVPVRMVDVRCFGTIERISTTFWLESPGERP